ncbi:MULTISPECIES: hypothetical protein [Xanthomonas]|uniref:Uncharacterized protein n=1 Tax=Xanthomonas dyei TaxID=743699 RepID=A0ABZ0DE65_9XANT|nr:hypothetical protein [Xanthomonas dyei]MCC4634764.1 hypothetical protein [Xanthomonas dyei pv. eucalypti]WOB26613.1 hypothetical protein NYR99_00905 [Xanthomonas dyei]WOB54233.1 hypothetical protein NYR95_00905 [Xanthomonas dyei]
MIDLEDTRHVHRTQADAIAEAIMLPETRARLQRKHMRAAQARSLAQRPWVARMSLPCMAIAALVAHFNGQGVAHGIVVGRLTGEALGSALFWYREGRTG